MLSVLFTTLASMPILSVLWRVMPWAFLILIHLCLGFSFKYTTGFFLGWILNLPTCNKHSCTRMVGVLTSLHGKKAKDLGPDLPDNSFHNPPLTPTALTGIEALNFRVA